VYARFGARPAPGGPRSPLAHGLRASRRQRIATLVRNLHPAEGTPRRRRARCDPAIARRRHAPRAAIRASNEVIMDALPNSSDTSFQIFLAKLLEQPLPEWTEKQQMELEMARALSTEMVRLAESLRGSTDLARCLVLLRYSKVLDFILTSLAARRDIHPQTLRTLFRLANLKVDDAYPV